MTPPGVTPTSVRRCGYCEASLAGRDPRARYCDNKCRAAAHKARTRYGPQIVGEVRSSALPASSPARNAERMRERRRRGPIRSDKRIAFSKAVTAAATLVREVARVTEPDALAMATQAMAAALPARFHGEPRAVSDLRIRREAA